MIYLCQGLVDKNNFSTITRLENEQVIAHYTDNDFLMKDVYDYLVEKYGYRFDEIPNSLTISCVQTIEYIGHFTKILPLN